MTTLTAFDGITGTIHAAVGDHDAGIPAEVRINGRVVTLSWVFAAYPEPSSVIEAFTLHIAGMDPLRRKVEPPAAYGQGDELVLEQRVELDW